MLTDRIMSAGCVCEVYKMEDKGKFFVSILHRTER